jgi:transglutaminase-like putative cysteine protease
MLIDIRHATTYRFEGGTRYSIQVLRLTPPSFVGQRVLAWRIDAPGLMQCISSRDGYGNHVQLCATSGWHDSVTIEALGRVETAETNGIVQGLPQPAPLRVYLRETAKTKPDPAIRDLARSTAGAGTLERLHELMGRIRAAVRYEIGATHEHTSAAEALADGKGVCQDHAHVFISAARVLAIPARYVNGYLVPTDGGSSEAHHAWAEAWVADLGWIGFDPANGVCPTQAYVRLATGLDAGSAAPIRGLRRGGANETLDVRVEVQQQSAQQ